MAEARWKVHERKVARALGVERMSRGADFGKEGGDTTPHPIWSIEIKYRSKISKFIHEGLAQARKYDPSKTPILVLKEKSKHGELVVMNLSDFVDHMGKLWNTQ